MNADARTSPADRPAGRRLGGGSVTASARGVTATFAATAEAPTLARQAASPALVGWPAEWRDAALLVISELVTNAVVHGSAGPADCVALVLRPRAGATRIEVSDQRRGRGGAAVWTAAANGRAAGSGWGLALVATLSDRWGVEREPTRTRVWCELDGA